MRQVRRVPRQPHSECPALRVVPCGFGHFAAVRAIPDDVARGLAAYRPPLEELPAAQDGVRAAEARQPACPFQHLALSRPPLPGHPRKIAVLAVDVVVPPLSAAHLIAVQDHGHALAQDKRRQQVAHLLAAQPQDVRGARLALDAAVPAVVVVGAVAVALAVRLVVLRIEADQVVQRKPVVRRDEVDARVRLAAALLIEVAAARQAVAHFADLSGVTLPELAKAVAVLPVPLGPQHRKVAHLVAAVAHVPRFGNELHLREHRILVDDVEERAQPVNRVQLARQRGCKVEPEAIDVHLQHPVAQAVHDHLDGAWVTHVERVAGACEVLVVALVALHQPVVRGVVDPPERKRWAQVVALGGVVVDHVQDHFDPRLVERFDHRLEFVDRGSRRCARTVAAVRRKEPDRVVAPIVLQPPIEQVLVVHKVVHGHKLDR